MVLETGSPVGIAGWRRRSVVSSMAPALRNARLQALQRAGIRSLEDRRTTTVRQSLEARRDLEGRMHDGAQSPMFAALAELGARAQGHS